MGMYFSFGRRRAQPVSSDPSYPKYWPDQNSTYPSLPRYSGPTYGRRSRPQYYAPQPTVYAPQYSNTGYTGYTGYNGYTYAQQQGYYATPQPQQVAFGGVGVRTFGEPKRKVRFGKVSVKKF